MEAEKGGGIVRDGNGDVAVPSPWEMLRSQLALLPPLPDLAGFRR